LSKHEGHLLLYGVDLVDIAKEFGTPTFVFSEMRLVYNINRIKAAYHYPGIDTLVFYASKANSNLAILQLINQSGIGVEASSKGELLKSQLAGFDSGRIIFNGPAKTWDEVELALDMGIFCINVDSEAELDRIIQVAKSKHTIAPISIRIVPGIICGTKKGLESGSESSKFGVELSEVDRLLSQVEQSSQFLRFLGFHMHVGSQIPSLQTFKDAFRCLLETAKSCSVCKGQKLLLNLGGGFPIPYLKGRREKGLTESAESLFRANVPVEAVASETIGKLQDAGKQHQAEPSVSDNYVDLAFAIEPGRCIVADTAVLLTRVENSKSRRSHPEKWLILDAGFNILLETLDYKWYFDIVSVSHAEDTHEQPFRIGGPLCDGADVLFDVEGQRDLPEYRLLPKATKVGDYLAFLDVGAYTLEQMTTYNGRFRAAVVLIRANKDINLIRRRDTIEDLVAQDVLLPVCQ